MQAKLMWYTYSMEAVGDRIRSLSKQSLIKAKPKCLSAFHPKADTILRILAGRVDSTRCTAPILYGNINNPRPNTKTAVLFENLPKLNARYSITIHVVVISLTHPLVFLPDQTIACVGWVGYALLVYMYDCSIYWSRCGQTCYDQASHYDQNKVTMNLPHLFSSSNHIWYIPRPFPVQAEGWRSGDSILPW
jgi:hypothetical protein